DLELHADTTETSGVAGAAEHAAIRQAELTAKLFATDQLGVRAVGNRRHQHVGQVLRQILVAFVGWKHNGRPLPGEQQGKHEVHSVRQLSRSEEPSLDPASGIFYAADAYLQ